MTHCPDYCLCLVFRLPCSHWFCTFSPFYSYSYLCVGQHTHLYVQLKECVKGWLRIAERLLQVHSVTSSSCLFFSSFFLLSPPSTTFCLEITASTRSCESSNLRRNTSIAFHDRLFCHHWLQKKQNTFKIYLHNPVNNLVLLFVCCWNNEVYIRPQGDGPSPFAQSFTTTPLIWIRVHCWHRTGLSTQRFITTLLTPLQSEEEILSLLVLERLELFLKCISY